MDIRDLKFDDESFDVAIDKGLNKCCWLCVVEQRSNLPSLSLVGTMDAMMTAKGSVWDPPAQVVEDCTKEIDEVIRQVFVLTQSQTVSESDLNLAVVQ